MCGLTAILELDGRPVDPALLARMTRAMAHRGPDGEDIWVDGNIGLGHRRLSIIDVSDAGRQPMPSASGEWMIAYNGILYDYLERRARLEDGGVGFRGASDTEVIANSFERDGLAAAETFNGMFAIAAWCRPTRTLHLVRDRYGMKPLYYWFDGTTLLVASEIKALLVHPKVRVKVNPEALVEYFTFQNLFRQHTLFDGVHMLPTASHVTIRPDTRSIEPRRWWDFNFSNPDETMDFETAVEETQRLTVRAIERHLVSDVPVGCYLSGGLDTGALAAVASGRMPRLQTFTGGFNMSQITGYEANFDERREAELTAAHLQTEHYERVFFASDLPWSLPRVVHHLEDLRMGMTGTIYYMADLASRFVKVVLSGTGGDELFGGYPWRYYRVARSFTQDEYLHAYYDFWQRLVPASAHQSFFRDEVASAAGDVTPFGIMSDVFRANSALRYDNPADQVANSLYFESRTFLPGLLIAHDKLSSAHGIEERMPFLDVDLTEFAMKIPVRHKLPNLGEYVKLDENAYQKWRASFTFYNEGKNVLRVAMKEFLPKEVVERKKQGFSPPHGSWYRREAADFVDDTLLRGQRLFREFIDERYVRRVLEEHRAETHNHRLLIWSLLSFEQWCRIFLQGDDVTADTPARV